MSRGFDISEEDAKRLYILEFLQRRGWTRIPDARPQAMKFWRDAGHAQHWLTVDLFYGYERYQLAINNENNLAVYVSGR